jgi:hypothetical protein
LFVFKNFNQFPGLLEDCPFIQYLCVMHFMQCPFRRHGGN